MKRKKRRNIHRNISACRIAMIMKFSKHSWYYICLLWKPFQLLKVNAILSNNYDMMYELKIQCKEVIVTMMKQPWPSLKDGLFLNLLYFLLTLSINSSLKGRCDKNLSFGICKKLLNLTKFNILNFCKVDIWAKKTILMWANQVWIHVD